MIEHDFQKDSGIGRDGEVLFSEYLTSRGILFEYVGEDIRFQPYDIDFVVHREGKPVLVEVKNDTKISYTGNIFYESVSNVDYGTVGCFEKTRAEWIVICAEPERRFYIVRSEFLRDYVAKNKDNLKYISRVAGSNSAGYLIPLSEIIDEVTIVPFA